MAALGAEHRGRGAAGRHRHGGAHAHPRRRHAGLGHRLRRERARGDAPGPRRGLAGDVAVAQHALPRARHERSRLGAADRAVLGLLVRSRALRAVVGAGRRDDAARSGLRLPLRRPPRRGREHDAADAPGVVVAVAGRARRPRAARAAALLQAIGGLEAFRRSVPGPADAVSGRPLPALRAQLPALESPPRSSCCTRASPTPTRATARRRRSFAWRGCARSWSSTTARSGSSRASGWPSCSSTSATSSPRPTSRSRAATSAARPPSRRWWRYEVPDHLLDGL